MEDKSIIDVLTNLKSGESIQIRQLEDLQAIEISARYELYHRGPAYGCAIKMSLRDIVSIKTEYRDIHVRNAIVTVINQVRQKAQAKRKDE